MEDKLEKEMSYLINYFLEKNYSINQVISILGASLTTFIEIGENATEDEKDLMTFNCVAALISCREGYKNNKYLQN